MISLFCMHLHGRMMKKKMIYLLGACLALALCVLAAGKAKAAGEALMMERLVFGLVAYVAGLFIVVEPREAWRLSRGRKYKNAEPSKMALGMQYLTGAIAILIGVGILFL